MGTRDPVAAKRPIFAQEAEQSVIGALLLDNEAYDRICDTISANDFYISEHAAIYRAIEALLSIGKHADVITVFQRLQDTGVKIERPLAYLNELASNTPSAANIVRYAEIVRDRAMLRGLARSASKALEMAYKTGGREAADVIDQAQAELLSLTDDAQRANEGFRPITPYLAEVVQHVDDMYHREDKSGIVGLATGFTALDELTSGLMDTDFIVIGARPAMGKTALSMNIAEYVATSIGRAVAVASMEMGGFALAMRLLASASKLSQNRLRAGRMRDEDWPRLTHGAMHLNDIPIYVKQESTVTPTSLRAAVRKLKRMVGEKQLGLIIVDYLQLMDIESPTANRAADLAQVSRALKKLAMDERVPVIALAQVNREVEKRTNKRPVMSDIKDCGAIEQDADQIWFLYRDEVYNPDSMDKGSAELIVEKQRNGARATIRLAWRGDVTRFEDFSSGPQGST
ncbi:replicative DNA helicase [Pandoraea pnomenusa]|uniref:Replicative DNA helicase n=1 Tax=Pandoraea pnomenusa TaxID=93220 RepID=A0A378YTD6_9BURK|nr:replicative DNA helicase [Pandoraea pnomenusa]AIU28368.1 replicative DNA helicase [Pandoraea pnomenusa]MBN9093938.1 replicative DNA helicase [Pandoraea pnomenusa]SUA80436.1 Replicative DNA helicase [Pandoraea pnomenusa]